MENNEDQNIGKIRIFARFCHAALPALTFSRPYPGWTAKARENSNFVKILVHTFVRPHRSASDSTLMIQNENQ